MKKRFGFVSNSSSSSFIIGTTKNYNNADGYEYNEVLNITMNIKTKIDVNHYVTDVLKNKDDVEKYIDYHCIDIKNANELRHMIKNQDIYIGSFSDSNTDLEAILCANGINNIVDKSNDIISIENELKG